MKKIFIGKQSKEFILACCRSLSCFPRYKDMKKAGLVGRGNTLQQ